MRRAQPRRDAVRITSAPRSQAEDQRARMVKYSISMGIRTVCLVLAFLTDGVLQWVMVVGAVILPYVAVLLANAGRERTTSPESFGVPAPGRPALGPARGPDRPDDRGVPGPP